jgi:hypothetical protein
MNHHLNIFRFFNESTEKEFIENNLSRAFALCLTSNGFFLNEYIKGIVSGEDYQYLFSSISSDTKCVIDIQIDTATIEKENFNTVYAVAMTADRKLNMDDFFAQPQLSDKKNITDILITIKDIAVVIEVKRSGEDCKAQLFNQVLPFVEDSVKNKIEIKPKSYSWQDVVKLLERVKHVQQLASQNSIIINDFLELSEVRYPEWFEPKPFNTIHFLVHGTTPNQIQLSKRMKQALAGVAKIAGDDFQLLPRNDRLGISVPFGWASEFIPYFSYYEDGKKELVEFCIWPANTKQQGWSIFDKPLDWIKKQSLVIDGKEYPLSIGYEVKLCHFQRYVSAIVYTDNDILKPLHTYDNFVNQSGRWNFDKWKELEELFDEHFKPEFKWRDECNWEENFINTDRSNLAMSLGFEVSVSIPFAKFKSIDKNEADIAKVSDLINKTVIAFKGLIA